MNLGVIAGGYRRSMSSEEREDYLVGLFDRVAEQSRNGVLFLVDEAHKLGVDEFREFGQAFQVARSRANKPFDVVVAGLPDLLSQAQSPHSATFLSRMQPNERVAARRSPSITSQQ